MADIALISVLSTSTVAIVVPTVTAWATSRRARLAREWAREDDERKHSWAREDELRDVLSVASSEFHRTHLAVTAATRVLADPNATRKSEDEALTTLSERLVLLWDEESRLAVRLGLEDWIFAPFVAGVVQYQKAQRVLLSARETGAAPDEATRLGKLAVQLQHEFWRRAATQVGPSISRPGAGEVVRARAADRAERLQDVIDATFREFDESDLYPLQLTEEPGSSQMPPSL